MTDDVALFVTYWLVCQISLAALRPPVRTIQLARPRSIWNVL
jgi:hypothetical protein